jgi:enamine deaminase RidA (YjgF/YER057c/UK114 family)
MKALIPVIVGALLASPAFAQDQVKYFGNPRSPISSGVMIPAGSTFFWSSGTGPAVVNRDAPAGSPERYGDTNTQAKSVLTRLGDQLKEQGLSLKDVAFLRCYLVPDPNKGGKIDTQGWNAAYGEFFGTAENPTKPARTTVGVASLVGAGQLIEVEVYAVVPAKK